MTSGQRVTRLRQHGQPSQAELSVLMLGSFLRVPGDPTERYLGCTQRIASAVNDRIGIEP